MTREQLDAIRARVEAAKSWRPFTGSVDDIIFGQHALKDVPALLAEVERLTAERDAAFKRGVAAMREAARTYFVDEAKKWQREGDEEMELRYLRLAGEIRAIPDPEDRTSTEGKP